MKNFWQRVAKKFLNNRILVQKNFFVFLQLIKKLSDKQRKILINRSKVIGQKIKFSK